MLKSTSHTVIKIRCFIYFQGLVGAIFEGVGTSLGSFIGGRLYGTYGGWITFRAFGIGSLICCVFHAAVQFLLKDKMKSIVLDQGKNINE